MLYFLAPALCALVLLAAVAPLASAQQPSSCSTNFGGTCQVDTTCNPGLGGRRPGECPGASNVQCCLNFRLVNAATAYDSNRAWQRQAADAFQATLNKYPATLRNFACRYRQNAAPPASTFCGAPILLSNALNFFDGSAAHTTALNELQAAIEAWPAGADRTAWQTFVQKFRNLPAAADNDNAPDEGAGSGTGSASCVRRPASQWSLNQNGLGLITHFEGWYSCCYVDTEGVWTIGYGHACHVNNSPDSAGNGCLGNNRCRGCISRQRGDELKKRDMAKFETCVRNAVRVAITENQFAALVSFAFNVGCGGFQSSTLLRLLNSNQLTPAEAQRQFTRWHSGCTAGLMRRRYTEAELFSSCAAQFPCTFSSCQLSYGYTRCSGTCSHCGSCIGCGSSARAFQRSLPIATAFAELNVTDSSYSCGDLEFTDQVCRTDTNAADASGTWACSRSRENTGDDRTSRTACSEEEDLPLNTATMRTRTAIELCRESTANVATATRIITFDSWQTDALKRITRGLGLARNEYRIQVTVSKAPEGSMPVAIVRTFAPNVRTANVTVRAVAEMATADDGATTTEDITALTVACANANGDCSSPFTFVETEAGSDPAISAAASTGAMRTVYALATGAAAGLTALSSSNSAQRAVTVAAGAAGLAALAALPTASAQPAQAFCIAFVNVTVLLAPSDYEETVAAIQDGTVTLDGIDLVGSFKSGEIQQAELNAICSDDVALTQLSLCSAQFERLPEVRRAELQRAATSPLLLIDLPRFFNPTSSPHQRCALQFLQNATQSQRFFQDFSCAFRQLSRTDANPYCGAVIQLESVLTVIRNQANGAALPHQTAALQALQRSVETSAQTTFAAFVRQWRNEEVCVNWLVRRDGRCGASFDGAGCDPNGNSPCCSAGNWCGVSDAHCTCATCSDFRRAWTPTPAAPTNAPTNAPTSAPTRTRIEGNGCAANHPATGRQGVCTQSSRCTNAGGITARGLCPNDPDDVLCCSGDSIIPVITQSSEPGLTGDFANLPTFRLQGNNGRQFTLVKIPQAHLTDPGAFHSAPTARDNSINVAIISDGQGRGWEPMRRAAAAAGVGVRISSAFRTFARQQYFWNCYVTGSCNGGALAARPGTSNHGNGIALDLNTNCGGQSGGSPPSACTSGSSVYRWLRSNAQRFGFIRTVRSEPWHWEFLPGRTSPSYQ